MPKNPPFDPSTSNFSWLAGQFTEIIFVLIYVVFAITFIVILWQIISGFIINGGEQNKVAEAKKTIGIGIIVLVVMSTVWGIVALIRSSII